ncbi:c-type cytochrome [Rudanella paleaurantiibacter]|uniref:C-type cytochrome n=1 Tax=Rudanella paleaurantiibacter TaxID=2614655 RepID=A0A7J5U1W4_9BACT|nr:c-type cytochrome [Rudanella paleaurantiibacter]KAB7731676.1 c-type cytochrome [Rudanella paleaurantiibacter]
MYNNSLNKSLKTSRLSRFCGVLTLSLTLLLNGGQVNAQDSAAAAGGGPAAATPAPASGGGDVEKGKGLFNNNCAQCHAVTDEVVVGPGLKGVRQRTPGEDWLYKWIRNSSSLIAAGDAYGVQVFNKYNKIQMSNFPNLTDDDIKSILDYIDSAGAPAAAAVGGEGQAQDRGGAGASAENGGGSPSNLFTLVLVALLVVMLLVLGVLLVIVTILSKAVQTTGTTGEGGVATASLGERLRKGLSNTINNPTIRSIVVWLFVLVVAKEVVDGAFSVGIQQGYAPKQPIQYSHKLHAGQYQIDCNYCHTGVNKGKSATIPAANICMNCHGVIKKESPEIQKIYTAIEENRPIEWIRVHNLPDLAYFNHAQHVNVGNIQCQTCHGEIEKMEVVEQRSSLTMGWCIDCHRKTEVNTKDNAYYDKLVALHAKETKEPLKVANIGGLECSKCHY